MTIQPGSSLLSHATGSFLTAPADAPPGQVAAGLGRHRFVVVLDQDTVASCLAAEAVAAASAPGPAQTAASAAGPAAAAGPAKTVGPATILHIHAPPCIVAAERMTFAEFCDGLSITLLDLGAETIVLLGDNQRVSGVLPVPAVQLYLGSGAHTPEPSEMGPHGSSGDHLMHGRPGLPLARVPCREPGCGLINSLPYYDPVRPPYCRNPAGRHRLRTEA